MTTQNVKRIQIIILSIIIISHNWFDINYSNYIRLSVTISMIVLILFNLISIFFDNDEFE